MSAASLAGYAFWRMAVKKAKALMADALLSGSAFLGRFSATGDNCFLADIADSAMLQFFGMAVVMVVVGSGPPLPEPYVKGLKSCSDTFMPW